jgi:hypothetical protein
MVLVRMRTKCPWSKLPPPHPAASCSLLFWPQLTCGYFYECIVEGEGKVKIQERFGQDLKYLFPTRIFVSERSIFVKLKLKLNVNPLLTCSIMKCLSKIIQIFGHRLLNSFNPRLFKKIPPPHPPSHLPLSHLSFFQVEEGWLLKYTVANTSGGLHTSTLGEYSRVFRIFRVS